MMQLVSQVYLQGKPFEKKDAGILDLKPCKLARPFSLGLVIITVILYILLGNV